MYLTAIDLRGVCGIYAWIHRASGMCYVGSALDIGKRTGDHIRDARGTRSTTLHHRAIREFGVESFDVELLCECRPDELKDRETFYIALFNAASIDGFNSISKPGVGFRGGKLSEASKERMSRAAKGRKFSPEAIQRSKDVRRTPEFSKKMSEAKRGTKRSQEAIEKHRAKMLGHEVSEETRRLLSIANKGQKPSDLAIQKTKELHALRRAGLAPPPVFTEESRANLATFKGKHHTEESKAKIGAGSRGKKQTPEQREAQRQRKLEYYRTHPPRICTDEERAAIAERTRQQHARKRAALMACEI